MSQIATAAPLRFGEHGVRSFRWFVVTLLFLATTINYIDRQILALLKPILDVELGWTNEEFGWVNSAFFGVYAASYVVFGWFIDKVGVKFGFSLSIVWWGLALAAHHAWSATIYASTSDIFPSTPSAQFPALRAWPALWVGCCSRLLRESCWITSRTPPLENRRLCHPLLRFVAARM